jgi:uncharacterized protein YbjQ (UPF0145 family)
VLAFWLVTRLKTAAHGMDEQAGRNQEMVVFTQGIYEARELAVARMQAEAAQAGSSGIVGVSVEVNT